MIPVFGRRDPQVEYRNRTAAYGVICRGGAFAAVQNARGLYFLPGGGADTGETPEQTVLREVREELGCNGTILHCLGQAVQFFFAASDNRHYRMEATFFTVDIANHYDSFKSSDGETLCWLPMGTGPEKLFHACHTWAVQKGILL
ncbi:MAG: NUDIX domain-containing protein [Armatimonadota bacterium]